jgi:hypothetical protein
MREQYRSTAKGFVALYGFSRDEQGIRHPLWTRFANSH